eukprot:6013110-Amphidinium_carterae.1
MLKRTVHNVDDAPAAKLQKVKIPNTIEQGDDHEVPILSTDLIKQAFAAYREQMGAYPAADEEPTTDQLVAIAFR